MDHTPTPAPAWQQDIFKVLKEGGVRQIAYVPDAGHSHAIRSAIADPDIEDIVLTTEEEGVAVVSGAWLGGQRAVLLMQSSGVGNCVNMFSLLTSANFPFFTLVTMRGEYADFNPWQGPMGRATQGALELMGIGSLATIAAKQPRNLTIVVLDNGHFGETGMQRSHTSLGTDLVAVAKGFGITDAYTVDGVEFCTEIAERAAARRGPTFVQVFIEANEPPRALPPRDGVFIKNRFRSALGLKPF